jgi:Tol biopolymer transport system component
LTRFIPDPKHNLFGLNPKYSPSGRSIAFDTGRGIVKMRANGRHRRLLVPNGESVDWSPNGRKIAFVRGERIFVARANGHGVRSVTGGLKCGCDRADDDPAWSPSGRRIAYSQFDIDAEDNESTVHTIKPTGKGDREVVSGYSPDW